MPPKKTAARKTKKSPKKTPEKSENEPEVQFSRSVLDAAILKDHLDLQCDEAQNAQASSFALRRHARDTEQKLQQEIQDHRDITADLSRQYKTMQSDLTQKVKRLKEEVIQLQKQLVQCQGELSTEKSDRGQVEEEKDAVIVELQHKLDSMETDYEKILHDTLDSLTSQLSSHRQRWEDESSATHQEYKDLLADFGLNKLDI